MSALSKLWMDWLPGSAAHFKRERVFMIPTFLRTAVGSSRQHTACSWGRKLIFGLHLISARPQSTPAGTWRVKYVFVSELQMKIIQRTFSETVVNWRQQIYLCFLKSICQPPLGVYLYISHTRLAETIEHECTTHQCQWSQLYMNL